ncbi:aromatic amino acid lyase [Streptomyces mirabilis]|uniref:aromatic amino acid ammonia-lyase n=1 Tax=Streptomyces mirabilis TaxID=68239 RepID=UPI001BB09B37|nr:aromatic amino acid ammonia-lyase [Streptomyces mirabilis]QUW78711.1 aromatic amino acid lyase [Streptomyces mirabilis]
MMSNFDDEITLDGSCLTLAQVEEVARGGAPVRMDAEARARAVEAWVASQKIAANRPVYGRTTGVGANKTVDIEIDGSADQDYRLLRSVASGFGPWVKDDVLRAMLAIRANQMLAGGSGVHVDVVDAFVQSLALRTLPRVHAFGSIGTGDLTAMCETALCLIGESPWQDGIISSRLVLHPGDGLAIMESNALTLASAALACRDLERLLHATLTVATMSLIAVRGSTEPFDAHVHAARPHPGQQHAAAVVRQLLDGQVVGRARIQDPYGFRALPQVMGPAFDALGAAQSVLAVEINAAAENPLVSASANDVFHNGNFHAAPVALALDQLRIALVQAAQLAQIRLCALSEPEITGLTPFLATGPAGSSGIMMLEYDAAAAVGELRAAAFPAALGHVVISRGAEDHASFADQAARRTTESVEWYRRLIACELVGAVRALRLGGNFPEPGTPLGRYFAAADAALDRNTHDRPLSEDIEAAGRLLPDLWGQGLRVRS